MKLTVSKKGRRMSTSELKVQLYELEAELTFLNTILTNRTAREQADVRIEDLDDIREQYNATAKKAKAALQALETRAAEDFLQMLEISLPK